MATTSLIRAVCPAVGASIHVSASSLQSDFASVSATKCIGSSSYQGKRMAVSTKKNVKHLPSRRSGVRAALKDVPKQFREENLKEGLMNNYKNVPSSLYGLNPMQIDMFNTEDSPMKRQAGLVTAESITSLRNYQEGTGLWSARDIQGSSNANVSMAVSMYRGGGAAGRPRSAPPDLPSLLLDARICYLGMPIVPAVTELIIAQLLFLQYDDPRKPIYFYINSPGTQNEQRESVGFETEAYAIADTFDYVKNNVYTVNCGYAFGQAAMLLAMGTKGFRAVQPHAVTKVYAPRVGNSSGSAIDMYVKQKELDANTRYYIELLSLGTGKSEAVIAKDISRTAYYRGQEAIDYGLADKIIEARGVQMDKKNYDSMLAESKMASRNPSNPSRVYRPGGAPAPVPAGGGRK